MSKAQNKASNKAAEEALANAEAGEEMDLELVAGEDIGGVAAGMEFAEVDPNESIPHFVPGQNWKVGQVLAGKYLRTDTRYSTLEKKPNWRKEPTADKPNRVARDAIILEDMTKGGSFAIWSVGVLKNFFPRVPEGAPVAVKYMGLGDKPFKVGQSIPHVFEFQLGKGYKLLDPNASVVTNNQASAATQASAQQ